MVKAAVLYEQKSPMIIEDVELDDPKAGEVLVKIGAAGICRSDRHYMHGDAPTLLPVVLGHEGAGTVEAVGPGVTSVRPGQQVILSFVSSCGRCKSCLTGNAHLCDAHAAAGAFMFDGTTRLHKGDTRIHHFGKTACFSEHSVMPEAAVVPIDTPIGMDIAAMIGCCVPTGVGAVISSAKVKPGSTVAVVGCGGVGLNVIMGAAISSASKIIAVDIRESQLEFAMKFGATHTVNASDKDPVAQVKELTDGKGVDYAFEVFGSADTTKASYDMTAKSGTVTVVGIAPVGAEAGINAVDMVRNEKTMRGTYYGSTQAAVDMPKLVDMYLSKKLSLDDLVVRHYSLDQINEAYDDMDNGEVGRGIVMF